MSPKLKTALTQSPREWAVLLHAFSLFFVISAGLALASLPRVRRLLRVERAQRRRSVLGPEIIARQVDRAARCYPFRVVCLQRSLCLEHLLRFYGFPASFRLGVRRQDEELEAHAWVECHGRPIAEGPNLASFQPMERASAP
ncbi:MAG: lasso peptide biosynthesis B2 protein [Acidobacteriota bacterium]